MCRQSYFEGDLTFYSYLVSLPDMKVPNLIVVLSLMIVGFQSWGQQAVAPKESPLAITRMRYKDAYCKLTYSQPHKRGREIFGKLVPYGEVWRLGANEATELSLTKDILINNQSLKAGTYSLFCIPQADKWTFIVNSEPGLWGSYNYNQKLDVMRFEIPVQKTKVIYEPFTMTFDQRNELADLVILWDDVRLAIPIKFIN
jgi:hypothetical protein